MTFIILWSYLMLVTSAKGALLNNIFYLLLNFHLTFTPETQLAITAANSADWQTALTVIR